MLMERYLYRSSGYQPLILLLAEQGTGIREANITSDLETGVMEQEFLPYPNFPLSNTTIWV